MTAPRTDAARLEMVKQYDITTRLFSDRHSFCDQLFRNIIVAVHEQQVFSKFVLAADQIVYLREPLYYYMVRRDSIMGSRNYEKKSFLLPCLIYGFLAKSGNLWYIYVLALSR